MSQASTWHLNEASANMAVSEPFWCVAKDGGGVPLLVVSEEEQFQEEHNSAAFTCKSTSTNVAE